MTGTFMYFCNAKNMINRIYMITVAKFGGTSVQDAEAINRLLKIIKGKNEQVVVVVSAMATITDTLVEIVDNLRAGNDAAALDLLNSIFKLHTKTVEDLHLNNSTLEYLDNERSEMEQLIKALHTLGEVSPKSTDIIISFGERLSSFIIAEAMKTYGLDVMLFESQSIIRTDSNISVAEVDFKATNKLINKLLLPAFDKHKIIVCAGFIAKDKSGNITTLGRGGSDYSAAIIAAGINADRLEIWTDVSGIMTADPRYIKNARIIKELTYPEAAELAYFGAKVLHPKTIQPAIKEKIPVYVRNSSRPEHSGTKIVAQGRKKKILKAIAFRKNITVVNITSNIMHAPHGFLKSVFDVFDKYKTAVEVVTTSEISISLAIENVQNLPKIKNELRKIADINIMKNYGVVCAVGEGIRDAAGVGARFFGVLKGINISMVSIGASEVNISIIVKAQDIQQAVELLHNEFFVPEPNSSVFY